MIAYSVLKLLGDDPKAELWPTVIIKQTDSIQEMNARFYNEKRNFINENRPRYRQVIEFIKFNNNCTFTGTPEYSSLKKIFLDLFKGERDHEKALKEENARKE